MTVFVSQLKKLIPAEELLEKVGFVLNSVLKFRLPSKSFWLYEQKHREVPQLNHEYVLVVRR